MKKSLILALGLACAAPPLLAAPAPSYIQLTDRTLDALSADGSAQLVRSPASRLSDAGGELVPELVLRLGYDELATLSPAGGLALRKGERESSAGLPADSYFTPLSARFSADGRTLAFAAGSGGTLRALRWQAGSLPEALVPDGSAWLSGVSAISDDGQVIAGWLLRDRNSLPQGFVWRQGKGLAVLDAQLNLPRAISADGRTLAGTGLDGTLGQLRQSALVEQFASEDPLGGNKAIADWALVGASDDGQRLAGYVKRADKPLWQGFLWDRDAGFVESPQPPLFDAKAGAPEVAAAERAVLKAYALGDANRLGALRKHAWQWQDGKMQVLKKDAELEAMSRDGKTFVVRDGKGALVEIGSRGERALASLLPADLQGELALRAISADGRRMWLRDEAGRSVQLLDGQALAPTVAATRAQPAAFSADARTVAGIYVNDPAGVRPVLRWDGARVDARSCRSGGSSYGLVFLSADGNTLAVSHPDSFCLFKEW
ncbi:hypothetical protein [Craterilacuibacter sinensis]|uniref:Uncharacterized protein n=1 Tax=Craterilacuibacter sinensis TaxID=2686017 RepID=A0A845BNX5_9NEIS|nr:hypothetical protein [Craterilacuibacter sinensis]MXR36878.1 hypothetical protein [Craterilacuibacter sinensis]